MKLCRFVILFVVVVLCLDTLSVHSFPIRDQNVRSSSLDDSSQYKRQYSDTTDTYDKFTTPTITPPAEETNMSYPIPDSGNKTLGNSSGDSQSGDADDSQIQEEQQQIAQEEMTIGILVKVLCTLAGFLTVIAVIIMVRLCRKRSSENSHSSNSPDEDATPLSKVSENNGSISSRGDGGAGGVGSSASDRGENELAPPLQEKSQQIIIDQVSLALPPELHLQDLPVQHTVPSAPPAEKIEEVNLIPMYPVGFSLSPPASSPPAYTPTAPPSYALPHAQTTNEANHSVQDIILHTEGIFYVHDDPPSLPQPSAQTEPWHISNEGMLSLPRSPDELSPANQISLTQQSLPSEQAGMPQRGRPRPQRHNSCEI